MLLEMLCDAWVLCFMSSWKNAFGISVISGMLEDRTLGHFGRRMIF